VKWKLEKHPNGSAVIVNLFLTPEEKEIVIIRKSIRQATKQNQFKGKPMELSCVSARQPLPQLETCKDTRKCVLLEIKHLIPLKVLTTIQSITLLIVESGEDIYGPQVATSRILLELDSSYNILVCLSCKTGISFNHIVRHLRDNHGVKMTLEEVKTEYQLVNNPMDFDSAREWLSSHFSVKTAVTNIPIVSGLRCKLCH
jgi:Orsellinic acid/F9775 biosynthesis cluster protein D